MKVLINSIIAMLIAAAVLFGISKIMPQKITACQLQDIYNNVDFDHAQIVRDLAYHSPRILLTVEDTGNYNFIIKKIEVAKDSHIKLADVKNMF